MTTENALNPKYPLAKVSASATIPEICRIDEGCEISPETILGKDVVIRKNVSIIGKVHLERSVNIRENVILVGPLHISEETFIAKNAVIGLEREDDELANKETRIDSQCRIGIGAEIIGGVHIGRHVWIRSESKVIGDAPDYGLLSRSPAILERFACPNCGGFLRVKKVVGKIHIMQCERCGINDLRFVRDEYSKSINRVLLPNGTYGDRQSTMGDNARWIHEKEMSF